MPNAVISAGKPRDSSAAIDRALCALHHALFDLGVLGLTEDQRVHVSSLYVARNEVGLAVDALAGNPAHPKATAARTGHDPHFLAAGSGLQECFAWQEELDGILRQVREWAGDDASIAVSVPTRNRSSRWRLTCPLTTCPPGQSARTGPRRHDGVHVGTLQRFKGLEYQWMILAGITDAAVPGQRAIADPARQHRELMRARSLLFVAATQARDILVISWNGQPSRFLSPVQ